MGSWRALGYRFLGRARRIYWFAFRPHTAGVKCVIEHDGAWLMVRNTYGHRRWTFPGGGIGRGESAEAAVRREVLEEVGIVLDGVAPVGTYQGATKANDTVTVFCAAVRSAAFEIDRGEIAEARWIRPSAIPGARSPSVDTIRSLLTERAAATGDEIGRCARPPGFDADTPRPT